MLLRCDLGCAVPWVRWSLWWRFAGVGEAEAGVARCAFGQGGGEDCGVDVVVVVYLCGGFSWM
jgi:hypothetical protein